MIQRWFVTALLILPISIWASIGIEDGLYTIPSEKSVLLRIEKGHYHIWFQQGEQKMDIQAGRCSVEGNRILFRPDYSNLPDLGASAGEILDRCRLRWEGDVFVNTSCHARTVSGKQKSETKKIHKKTEQPAAVSKKVTHASASSEKWRAVEKGIFRLSVPSDAKVSVAKNRLRIEWRDGVAELLAGNDDFCGDPLENALEMCAPTQHLRKGETDFYLCASGAPYTYLQAVGRNRGTGMVVTYTAARNYETLKRLSLMIASVEPANRGSATWHKIDLPLHTWRPRDGSFSISVPQNWRADGGTADMGRNGYIRLVRIEDPEGKRGVVGIYYPFYQYAQMGYTRAGAPPMEPEDYVKMRLFQDLAQYNILFDNLTISHFKPEEALGRQMTEQQRRFNAQMGVNVSPELKAFMADATFTKGGRPFRMVIEGTISYTTMPYNGASTVVWGPAPILLGYAPQGELSNWYPLFKKIAVSWQTDLHWLMAHQKRAAADAASVLRHYRKMSKIIQQSEARMNRQLEEWEGRQHLEQEIFWDTFYALGGEERYDHPQTGEEIDVPTGADKYLYDAYSEGWVGIHMDRPDAEELVRALKEKGFVELVPHRY